MSHRISPPSSGPFFKPSVSDRLKEKNRDDREDREGNDNEHLAALRKCPCSCCGVFDTRNDPHHLLSGTGERGMGMRSTDRWTVPLCRAHHDELHRLGTRKEAAFFRSFGIFSHIDLAAALWSASPDVERMRKILLAHRNEK